MFSFNKSQGYTPEKIQQIADNLPPFAILAILKFPIDSSPCKSNSRFSHLISNCAQYLEPGWDSVEDLLLSEHVVAKQIWTFLYKRDIGLRVEPGIDIKASYLFYFNVKIIHALQNVYQLSRLFPELDETDIENIQKLKNAYPRLDSDYQTIPNELKQILVILVKKLASNDLNGMDKSTPLMRIASQTRDRGYFDTLLPLVHAIFAVPSLDVNTSDPRGFTMLMYEADDKNSTFVKLLLDVGAKVDQINHHGDTVLFYVGEISKDFALTEGQLESARLLIAAGADPRHQNEEGDNALGCTAFAGNPHTLELLLASGVPSNMVNKQGDTPLIIAARRGHLKCVEVLLKHSSAGINHQNTEGDTALLCAVRDLGRSKVDKGEDDHTRRMIELLVQYGADPALANKKGETAYSVDANKGYNDVEMFVKNVADRRFAMIGGLGTTVIGLGIGLALGLWEDLPEQLEYPAWGISLIAIAPLTLFAAGFYLCKGQPSTSNTSIFSRLKDVTSSIGAGNTLHPQK